MTPASERSNVPHSDPPLREAHAAFFQHERIAHGELGAVLERVKSAFDEKTVARVLFFRDRDGSQIDFDLRGSIEEVRQRIYSPARSGPGRPKLGVMGREVSLLPRHWDWLETQPNGISAAIRRLVDQEIARAPDAANAARSRDATNRFLTALAGDLENYEEVTRSLFRGDLARFTRLMRTWPKDVRKHARHLAKAWFESRVTEAPDAKS